MIANSSNLGIVEQQVKQKREYSKQSKAYCAHLLSLLDTGSICWPTQIKAVAAQRVQTGL